MWQAKDLTEGGQAGRCDGRFSRATIAEYLLNVNSLVEYLDCKERICHSDQAGVNVDTENTEWRESEVRGAAIPILERTLGD